MSLEEADRRSCHREEDPRLPNPFRLQVALDGFLHLLPATEVDPQSHPGTECLPLGLTWAQSLRAFPLQYQTHLDLFSRVCITGGPQQAWGPPGTPAWGPPLRLFPETEVLLLEEARCARTRRAPPPPGRRCPPPPAGPWRTSRRRRHLRWAAGPPSTGKRSRRLQRRTASPLCPPPHGPPLWPRRPLLRPRPAGPGLLRCPPRPAGMRSPGSHSGTCPSRPRRPPCPHPDAPALFLRRPTRGLLLQ